MLDSQRTVPIVLTLTSVQVEIIAVQKWRPAATQSAALAVNVKLVIRETDWCATIPMNVRMEHITASRMPCAQTHLEALPAPVRLVFAKMTGHARTLTNALKITTARRAFRFVKIKSERFSAYVWMGTPAVEQCVKTLMSAPLACILVPARPQPATTLPGRFIVSVRVDTLEMPSTAWISMNAHQTHIAATQWQIARTSTGLTSARVSPVSPATACNAMTSTNVTAPRPAPTTPTALTRTVHFAVPVGPASRGIPGCPARMLTSAWLAATTVPVKLHATTQQAHLCAHAWLDTLEMAWPAPVSWTFTL